MLALIGCGSKAVLPKSMLVKPDQALDSSDKLPARLVQLHSDSISEGKCQDLNGQLAVAPATTWKVDNYTNLYAIPCGDWASVQTWKIYAEFNEPKGDGHGLFRRLFFTALDWSGNFVATDILYNWKWNDQAHELDMIFLYNGRQDCGSSYEYIWDPANFEFTLKSASQKTTCDGNMSAWPQIPLPKATPPPEQQPTG